MPIVIPPMNCERAVLALMIRPVANTPSARGTRTSPVSTSTRASTNWAPKPCLASGSSAATSSRVSTFASAGASGPSAIILMRSSRHAFTTAEPHDALPIDPPAIIAVPKSESPTCMSIWSRPHVERVGRDLRERRARARADVGRGDLDRVAAARLVPGPGGGGAPACRVGRRRHTAADQPAALATHAGRRIALGPAEPLRTLAQARDQVAAREALAALGIDVGIVADAQLDRIDPGRDRQLVHRRLECVHAGRLARRAHPGRRRDVQRDHAVSRAPVRRGVHHPARQGRLLGELANRRGLDDRVVAQRGQPPVAAGAEPHPLDRRRPVAGHVEHLLARDRDLHRAAHGLRCHHGEDHVRPRRPLGAEPAADVR